MFWQRHDKNRYRQTNIAPQIKRFGRCLFGLVSSWMHAFMNWSLTTCRLWLQHCSSSSVRRSMQRRLGNKSDEQLVWRKTRVILATNPKSASIMIHSLEANPLHLARISILAIEIPLYLCWWMVKELEFNQPYRLWRPVLHIPRSTKDIDLKLTSDC